MGWICVTSASDNSEIWVNTDHIIRVDRVKDRTMLHLSEIMQGDTYDMAVAERVGDVMNLIQQAGGKLARSAS